MLFIIHLPLEFLPVVGPLTLWCVSTLGAARYVSLGWALILGLYSELVEGYTYTTGNQTHNLMIPRHLLCHLSYHALVMQLLFESYLWPYFLTGDSPNCPSLATYARYTLSPTHTSTQTHRQQEREREITNSLWMMFWYTLTLIRTKTSTLVRNTIFGEFLENL